MKRTNLIVVGFAVLVLLLAGAAFVGGRFLNQTAPIGGLVPGGASTRDGKAQTRIEIEPAKELPNSAPDAIGPFVERKDNSVFVATASKFMVFTNSDGSVITQGEDSGQRLEIVVTSETTIYKDVTEQNMPRLPPPDGSVQQKIQSSSLAELGANSMVSAWGERRGDRLIAKLLVYTPSFVINAQ